MQTLAGRATEVATLQRAAHEAGRGHSRWVHILGEPGIGKTRLLAEFMNWADSQGCLVLSSRGAEFERDLPFGVVVDALDDYLAGLPSDRQQHLAHAAGLAIARIFPALRGSLSPPVLEADDDRHATFRAIRRLLESLAAGRTVVLAIDDLHWADEASRELMIFLMRRMIPGRLLLVLAWRRGQGRQLSAQLTAAGQDNPGSRVELGPLSRADAARLLDPAMDPAAVEAAYRDSGGNPFYLSQLTRIGRVGAAETILGAEREPLPGVPGPVGAAVAVEIQRLPTNARLLAQGAAVAGEPFDPALAAACAQLDGLQALEDLDNLVRAEIVHPGDSPRRFYFRHPIVRRAVYDSAAPGWRLAAHARAARALAEVGAPIAVQAHHLAISAQPGDTVAVHALAAAAKQAKGHAPAAAAHWLAAALPLVPATADFDEQRLEILVLLAKAQVATGNLASAQEAFEAALHLLRAGDPGWLPLVISCASVEHGLGQFAAARSRLLGALAAVEIPRPAARAALQLELAMAQLFLLDYEGATRWATAAVSTAAGVDQPVFAAALALRALVAGSQDNPAGSVPDVDLAASALNDLSDEQLGGRFEAVYYLAVAEYLLGRYVDADRHFRRLAAAGSAASGHTVPALKDRARVLARLGRLEEALDVSETAVEGAQLSGNSWLTAMALAARAEVLLLSGDLPAATAAGRHAADLTPTAAGYFRQGILRQLALIRLEAGDIAASRTYLYDAGAPDFLVVEPGTRCLVYETYVRTQLADGQLDLADSAAAQAETAARLSGTPLDVSRAGRSRARVLLASGDAALAAEHALASATHALLAGAVIEHAQALLLAGQAFVAAGAHEKAVSLLVDAERILKGCGAHHYRNEAARELRRLGVQRGGRTRPGHSGTGISALSGREQEIANLVADGCSNRDIAAALHLSVKTVETHLSRIFGKLAVPKRSGVAIAIERHRHSLGS